MSSTDPRPPSDEAHTIYGRRPVRPSASGRRRRWIVISLGIVLFALVLFWIFQATTPPASTGYGGARGGGARGARGGGAGGPPTSVNAARAVRGDMPVYLTELGTVTPIATVTVIPQISGVLQIVAFREGQMVKKGQLLAQIDPRPYQAALLQAQGTLAKDQAALAEARRDLTRYQTLVKQNSLATQTFDQQAALVKQDEGQVKTDEGAVATQKLNLIYCHVTAPVAGRVGLRQVDPGNYFTAGTSTGIVVITVLDPMDVLFTIPEDNLDRVAARMHAGAKLEAVALDRAQSKTIATGSLLTLDNQVDTTTGTVRAKARFLNGDNALFPNQFVNLRLTVDTLKNAVIVPTSAVLKGPNGMFVYVAEKSRFLATAKVTPVTLGPASGENTAILSGLDAGQVVITDGSDRLKDGSRVLLPGDCIPNRGGAGGSTAGRGAAGQAPKGGILGLFAKKPAQDPSAAMRCRPGEAPHSLLSGGNGAPYQAPGAAPAEIGATPATPATAAATAAQGPAPGRPQPVQGGSPPAGAPPAGAPEAGGGGGRGGRLQAMIAQLGLDPFQQAKARAIFASAQQDAETSGDYRGAMQGAFAKLDAILRPDQKVKLQQMRAQAAARRAQEGGGGPSDQ